MSKRVYMVATMGFIVLATGCARDLTTVSVRFATTPGHERFAGNPKDPQRRLASFPATHDDAMDSEVYGEEMLDYVDTPQVALWGGRYDGHNVTFRDCKLRPGDYTFAAWEMEPQEGSYEGWIHVNSSGNEIVDMFRDWKERLTQEKQEMAFSYESEGNLKSADEESWNAFRRQMRTIENLEHQISLAIGREKNRSSSIRRRNSHFMSKSVVLMFPEGDGSFHPTTASTFNEQDMNQVREGESVTKMLMVSNYHDIQWKLRIIERIRRELERAKAVRYEEAQRLERRKEIFAVTDHIHKNDNKFMKNEVRLQKALGHIDHLNEQIATLRERRMALAFASELTAPDGSYRPLEIEQRDLQDERELMQADLRRTQMMLEQTADVSTTRMGLERRKLWFQREIERIDANMGNLDEARMAMQTLKNNSQEIHRQGELRILTASIVGDSVPHRVREALQGEAIMTVRLEASDGPFTPKVEVASYEPEYGPQPEASETESR